MIVPDVNLLLYATVTGFPQHEHARTRLEDALNGQGLIGLASPALFGYIRIATNARVLTYPLPVGDAVGRVRQWLDLPNVRFLVPGSEHLGLAFDLLESIGTGANMTTDVQMAAYAIEQDAELCSNDSDFGRFPGLRWVDPLT